MPTERKLREAMSGLMGDVTTKTGGCYKKKREGKNGRDGMTSKEAGGGRKAPEESDVPVAQAQEERKKDRLSCGKRPRLP